MLQVGGGTFALRGDLWDQNTFDISPGRDLTVRSGLPAHSSGSNLFSSLAHYTAESAYTLYIGDI